MSHYTKMNGDYVFICFIYNKVDALSAILHLCASLLDISSIVLMMALVLGVLPDLFVITV